MKKVTISQIKGDSFNLLSVIEDCIEISPTELISTTKAMENAMNETISLDEALFFKKERLSKKLSATTDSNQNELMSQIQKQIRQIKLEPLGNAKSILEKNRNILELKNIQKILRYSIELSESFSDNSNNKVLDTLLNSDSKDDWEFLCTLLYYYLKFGSEERKEIFQLYSKKIEEKMSKLFVDSLKTKNMSSCRASYMSLEQLGKEAIIFEKYINSMEIMTKPLEIVPPKMNLIDLDNFVIENNTFSAFFQKLIIAISENYEESFQIFGEAFSSYFYDKIYRKLVFRALEMFMNIEDPCLYLYSLYYAYNKIDSLSEYIAFNPEVYLQEAFSQYFSKSVQKEKETFDIIFDRMLLNENGSIKYIILGKEIEKKEETEKDIKNAFEILLAFIRGMRYRSELWYSEEDEIEIFRYFFRKMGFLVDKFVVVVSEKIKIILGLSYFYLLSKKFMQDKFYVISSFTEKLNDTIQDAFEEQIKYVNFIMKGKINNLFFLEKTDYKKLLVFLKESIKDAEPLQGRNYNIFTDRILTYVYKRLLKQINTIVYNQKQSENLLHVVDEILGYVMFINRTTMVHKFTHLKDISVLIACPKEKFMDHFLELEDVISEKELKDLLKCRSDRESIKAELFKRID